MFQGFYTNWVSHRISGFYLILGTLIAFYLGLVRHLRYKNLEYIRKKYPDPEQLLKDPKAAAEVMAITAQKEFALGYFISLRIGLLKSFAVPEDAKILLSTKQLTEHTERRSEDTDILMSEIIDTPGRIGNQLQKDPKTPQKDIDKQWERWIAAIQQMNMIHSHYNIKNLHFLHTLSLSMVEPILWINKYEWRELDIREINAFYRFWCDVGEKMNIKDIPTTYEKILEFKTDFSENNLSYNNANWSIIKPSLQILTNKLSFPDKALKFLCLIISSIVSSKEGKSMGLPAKNVYISGAIHLVLRLRAFFVRHFVLPRTSFLVRTPFYPSLEGKFVPKFFLNEKKLYKNGYEIPSVGPEKFIKKPTGCPFI